ncbi:MAG: GTP 3',8-cyclase MoaA [Acidaminobacteraceae bacterium]
MIDSFGREINYLRISVTDLCNLRCKYCMPETGIDKKCHSEMLRNEEIIKIVKVMSELGITKIRITGGEPLVKKGILEMISEINKIPKIEEIVLTTNGILLADMAQKLKNAGVKRVNISLDTMDKIKFEEITRKDQLVKVLEGIDKAIEVGLTPVKINTVLIGGFNDNEVADFIKLTKERDIDVRFIELMPIGEASLWNKEKFLSTDSILENEKSLVPVVGKDKSSPAKYYKLPDSKGTVGLINPISCSFCKNCNRIRLTSDGKLKLCLHSDVEIDVINVLRDGDDIKEVIKEAITNKPQEHRLGDEDFKPVTRNMNRIGG